MKNIKEVNWDKGSPIGTVGNEKDSLPLNFNRKVVIEMEVSSKYQGKQVHLKILEEPLDNKFIAEITGFEFPAENYKDLSLYDKVYIDRECIYWLQIHNN